MKLIVYVLLALLLLYLVTGGYVFYAACVRRKEYPWFVEDKISKTPFKRFYPYIIIANQWLKDHETVDVSIVNRDGLRLHALWIPAQNAKGTILLAHGYRSTYLADFSKAFSIYHAMGFNMLVPCQRAHGTSQGRIITFGVKESGDMLEWIDYHNRHLGSYDMVLSGISMGASTVLYTADQNLPENVKGIIADCGFTSPKEIVSDVFTSVTRLPAAPAVFAADLFARLFGGFSFYAKDTRKTLSDSRVPVLLIHGSEDDFVSSRMSQQAYEACCSEKELLLVDGAGHAVSFLKDEALYANAVTAFLKKIIKDFK